MSELFESNTFKFDLSTPPDRSGLTVINPRIYEVIKTYYPLINDYCTKEISNGIYEVFHGHLKVEFLNDGEKNRFNMMFNNVIKISKNFDNPFSYRVFFNMPCNPITMETEYYLNFLFQSEYEDVIGSINKIS